MRFLPELLVDFANSPLQRGDLLLHHGSFRRLRLQLLLQPQHEIVLVLLVLLPKKLEPLLLVLLLPALVVSLHVVELGLQLLLLLLQRAELHVEPLLALALGLLRVQVAFDVVFVGNAQLSFQFLDQRGQRLHLVFQGLYLFVLHCHFLLAHLYLLHYFSEGLDELFALLDFLLLLLELLDLLPRLRVLLLSEVSFQVRDLPVDHLLHDVQLFQILVLPQFSSHCEKVVLLFLKRCPVVSINCFDLLDLLRQLFVVVAAFRELIFHFFVLVQLFLDLLVFGFDETLDSVNFVVALVDIGFNTAEI